MQVDVFALLTEARQKIAANVAAVEAQRDFWLASTDLSAAVIGGGASTAEQAASTGLPASGGAAGH
jgi:outer membrane protein TolC